jgi:hypothetical protein
MLRACLANQVGRQEAAENPFLEERLVMREAKGKMVLEPLVHSSDTPWYDELSHHAGQLFGYQRENKAEENG